MTQSKLNLRYILSTRKFGLMTVGVIGLAVLLVVVVILPQIQGSVATWGTLSKERKTVAQMEKKSAELSNFASSPLLAKSSQVDLLLPNSKPLLELLTGLYQVANVNQVNFTDVELAPGSIATESSQVVTRRKNTDYDSIDVALTVRGDLEQLNRFFDAIENVAPLSIITQLTLNQRRVTTTRQQAIATPTTPSTEFEANIIVTTYYFTKPVTAALQTPLPPIGAAEEELVAKFDNFNYVTLQQQTDIQGGGQSDLFGTTGSSLLPNINLLPTLASGSARLN